MNNFGFPLPLLSGLAGAIAGGMLTWIISKRARKQNYYIALVKNISDHNWNSLKEKARPGLCVSDEDEKILTMCYQHLNLIFFAWLHKDIIEKDGSLTGWKRWAKSIISGSRLPGNESFKRAYRDILGNGDLYPTEFRRWLETKLGLSADEFPVELKKPAP